MFANQSAAFLLSDWTSRVLNFWLFLVFLLLSGYFTVNALILSAFWGWTSRPSFNWGNEIFWSSWVQKSRSYYQRDCQWQMQSLRCVHPLITTVNNLWCSLRWPHNSNSVCALKREMKESHQCYTDQMQKSPMSPQFLKKCRSSFAFVIWTSRLLSLQHSTEESHLVPLSFFLVFTWGTPLRGNRMCGFSPPTFKPDMWPLAHDNSYHWFIDALKNKPASCGWFLFPMNLLLWALETGHNKELTTRLIVVQSWLLLYASRAIN